jgi:hypothetical protein
MQLEPFLQDTSVSYLKHGPIVDFVALVDLINVLHG